VILEERAHILSYESGALGALHGCQSRTLPGPGGVMDLDQLAGAIRPDYVHCPRTGLVGVEQTHMSAGGAVLPETWLAVLGGLCRDRGVPLHMDGARLAHAVVASGRPATDFTRHVDSVSLCLSKGLGAPVGSLVAGPEDFIERARFLRKRFGGWMRQSGLLAAAGLMALEQNVERLAEDHALARAVAASLDAYASLSAPAEQVETNLVLCKVTPSPAVADAPALAEALAGHGVRVLALAPDTLRFVTHLDVAPAHNLRLQEALEAILGPPEPSPTT
jgi:threonine aldolase